MDDLVCVGASLVDCESFTVGASLVGGVCCKTYQSWFDVPSCECVLDRTFKAASVCCAARVDAVVHDGSSYDDRQRKRAKVVVVVARR